MKQIILQLVEIDNNNIQIRINWGEDDHGSPKENKLHAILKPLIDNACKVVPLIEESKLDMIATATGETLEETLGEIERKLNEEKERGEDCDTIA